MRSHTVARPSERDSRQRGESRRTAEMVACVACQRRAERGANSDEGPDKTLPEIEMPGAAREVGHDERYHYAEYRGGHAIEQLDDDQQLRISDRRKQNAANRQRGEADEQQGTAAPNLRAAGRSTAIDVATRSCGTTMHTAISSVAHRAERIVTALPSSGSMAALARWNNNKQPAKMRSGRLENISLTRVAGLSARGRGVAPCARSGSISAGAI